MWRVGIQCYQPNGYLLVPGTQLNKQQLTTVLVGQSWKASGATPTWGELVGQVDVGEK